MNGFLIADKPTGMTSSDMVVFVRRRLPKGTAIGHGGTLDPEASGILPLCIGKATRLFDYIIDKQKTYVAELQLGAVTDTQDAAGKVLERRPVTAGIGDVRAVLPRFTGSITQIPPMYSAIKRGGKRLYQLARKGETIEVEPRPCRVDGIELMEDLGGNAYRIRVTCGKGVYIRTLCNDIGEALGCGAYMRALRRTAAGVFTLEHALSKEQIQTLVDAGDLASALVPMDAPLKHLPMIRLRGEAAAHAVRNGNVLKEKWMEHPAPEGAEAIRVYLEDRFAGIGSAEPDGTVRFRAMLLEADA